MKDAHELRLHELRLHELSADECMGLLRGHRSVGRIGYVVDGLAIIVPVNFVVDGDAIVFRTTKGSKLSWLGNHRRVAFEADQSRPLDQSGWSVLVHGAAAEVTDPVEVERLRLGPLRSWAAPDAEHWVRIRVEEVSGRRLRRRVRRVADAAPARPARKRA